MLKALQWILGIITLVITLYAIAMNPQGITLQWNPAAKEPLTIAAYLLILSCFGGGFLIGTLYYWLGAMPKRIENHKARKAQDKEIKALQKELETYKDTEIQDDHLLRD